MAALQRLLHTVSLLWIATMFVSPIQFLDDDELARRPVIEHDFFVEDRIFASRRSLSYIETETSLNFGSGECKVYRKISEEHDIKTFTVPSTCAKTSLPILTDVIASDLGGNNLMDITTNYLNSDAFGVREIKYGSNKEVALKLEFISTTLRLAWSFNWKIDDNLKIDFKYMKTEVISMTNMELKFEGKCKLGTSDAANTIIEKPREEQQFKIKKMDWEGLTIPFLALTDNVQVRAPGLAREGDNFKYSLFTNMVWQNIHGFGTLDMNDQYQLVLTTPKSTHTQAFGFAPVKQTMVITRTSSDVGAKPNSLLIFKLPAQKNVHQVISKLLTYPNIRSLPLLTRMLPRDWCVFVTPKDTTLKSDFVKNALQDCIPTGNLGIIKAGFRAKIQLDLRNRIKSEECRPESGAVSNEDADVLPEVAFLDVTITQLAVDFSFPEQYKAPLQAMLKCLGGFDFPDLPYNLFFKDGESSIVQIQEFTITRSKNYNQPKKKPAAKTGTTAPGGSTISESESGLTTSGSESGSTAPVTPAKSGKKVPFYKRFFIRITLAFHVRDDYRCIKGTNNKICIGAIKLTFQTNADNTGYDVVGLTTVNFGTMKFGVQLVVGGNRKPDKKKPAGPGEKQAMKIDIFFKIILQIPSITYTEIKQLVGDIKADDSTTTTPAPTPETTKEVPLYEQFGIKDFLIELKFSRSSKGFESFRMRGNPILFGWSGLYMEGMAWRPKHTGPITVYDTKKETYEVLTDQPKNAYAVGTFFKNINLDWFIQKLLGPSIDFKCSFLSNINGFLVYSNALGTVKNPAANKQNVEPLPQPDRKRDSFRKSFMKKKAILRANKTNYVNTSTEGNHFNVKRNIQDSIESAIKDTLTKRTGYAKPNPPKPPPGYFLIEEPEIEFTMPALQGAAVKKGWQFMLQWKVPTQNSKCLGSQICMWMVEKLGERAALQLIGYMNGKNIEITAKLSASISISPSLTFESLLLRIKIGTTPAFRIELALKLQMEDWNNGNPLKIFGAIEIAPPVLRIEAGFGGIIRHPGKDNTWFSIGNVFIGVGFTIAPPYWVEFQLGAKIILGKDGECVDSGGKSLCFQGYLGFSLIKPRDIWLYVKIDRMTVAEFVAAFEIKKEIPEKFMDAGFYKGLTISYASQAKSIPKMGVFVPQGLFIGGGIKILDFELFGKIIVQQGVLVIDVNMAPIYWAGGQILVARKLQDKLKLEEEEAERKLKEQETGLESVTAAKNVNGAKGPILYIELRDNLFKVQIQGILNIYGFGIEVDIRISETQIHVQFGIIVYGVAFRAALSASLSYTTTRFDQLPFKVGLAMCSQAYIDSVQAANTREIKEDLCASSELERTDAAAAASQISTDSSTELNNVFNEPDPETGKSMADKAKESLDTAERKKNAALNKEIEHQTTEGQMSTKIGKFETDLESGLKKLDDAKAPTGKRSIEASCKDQCGTVCVPFLGWNSRCWKAWWVWIGCPTWIRCKWRVPDGLCIAKCELSKLKRKFTIWLEQAKLKIKNALKNAVQGLKDLLNDLKSSIGALVELAKNVWNKIKDGLSAVWRFAQDILTKVAQGIIRIDTLQLTTEKVDMDACLNYRFKGALLSIEFDFDGGLCLNLNFMHTLINKILGRENVNREYPGLKDAKKNVESSKGELSALSDAEVNFDEDEARTKNKINEETQKTYEYERATRSEIPIPDILNMARDLPKRVHVPTQEEMVYIKASEEKVPEWILDTRSEAAHNAFENGPWNLVKNFKPVGLDEEILRDHAETGSVRSFDFEKMSSCDRVRKALIGYEDLANGLLETIKGLTENQQQSKSYKRSLLKDKEDLYYEIKKVEGKYNLTAEDKEDAFYWYRKYADGIHDFSKRSDTAMTRQDEFSLPIIRRQLNQAFRLDKGKTFDEFTEYIHNYAIAGYKRSNIPVPENINGEKILTAIKRDLASIINSDDDPITSMDGRLKDVHANIRSMKDYAKQCKNH